MLCLLFGFSPANQATSLDFSNWLVVLRIERGLQSMSFFALHRHSPSACVISSSMRRANQWTPDTRDRLSRHTCRPGAPRRNHGRAPGLGRRSGSGHGHGRNRLSRGLLGQAAQVAYSGGHVPAYVRTRHRALSLRVSSASVPRATCCAAGRPTEPPAGSGMQLAMQRQRGRV
jgi:hypothetical protein